MTVDSLSMDRYVGPVNPSLYPQLAVLLLAIGLFFMAWFFVYEVLFLSMHLYHWCVPENG
ncbi:unnamed protein product [Gongylonema pulchrum]|uniref:Dolichyl-diphosphooligosaccharide-protein glycosyltransferase subunit TMEM258 n=1 Tax=Gongylonema pulchrum TaxID=637853 RepID=A0A183EZ05_9BILA|nr:unnamed protein product [Gongylonema pulchrum]